MTHNSHEFTLTLNIENAPNPARKYFEKTNTCYCALSENVTWKLQDLQVQMFQSSVIHSINHGFHIHRGLWGPWTVTDRDFVTFESQ